jgi:hypothetical protein
MSAKRKPPKAKPPSKQRPKARTGPKAGDASFLEAFAKLLRSRKIAVPKGLADAPPEAYASQPASFVDELAKLPDAELKRYATQVGGYAQRQSDRARSEWERSPLIAELRRRKLNEPPPPRRATGASVSLAKPLAEWSDKELLKAAEQWSKLGR